MLSAKHEHKLRVVFDTNVIISGLLWKGPPKTLFDLVDDQTLELCVTPAILSEVRRVLMYSKILKPLTIAGLQPDDVIKEIAKYARIFPDRNLVHLVKEDPSDDVFLNCLLVSRAHALISGDAHLLKIGMLGKAPIVKPTDFLNTFACLMGQEQ